MQEIIVGRPRDGADRVTWLLDHSRFEQALNIIESDVTLSQATREQVKLYDCLASHMLACMHTHQGLSSVCVLLKNINWVAHLCMHPSHPPASPPPPPLRPSIGSACHKGKVVHLKLGNKGRLQRPQLKYCACRWQGSIWSSWCPRSALKRLLPSCPASSRLHSFIKTVIILQNCSTTLPPGLSVCSLHRVEAAAWPQHAAKGTCPQHLLCSGAQC